MPILTADDEAKICELYKNGLKATEVCKEVHKDSKTVRSVLKRAGILRKHGGHKKRSPLLKCWLCKQMFPREHMIRDRTRAGGCGSGCYKCTNEYQGKRRLVQHYGITIDNFYEKLAAQGNGCAICGSGVSSVTKTGKPMRLSVDHSHKTGALRGILCSRCNTGLGMLGDDIQRLEKAIDYLKKYGE